MKISQMWPSRNLDALDLEAFVGPQGAVVTVSAVDVTYYNNDRGDPEPAYLLYVEEFKKPIRLNKSNGLNISDALGSDDTDDWVGRHIRLRPFRMLVTDRNTKRRKEVCVLDVDNRAPAERPTLPPTRQDITGIFSEAQKNKSLPANAPRRTVDNTAGQTDAPGDSMHGIGPDTAIKIASNLKERGKTLENFVAHCRAEGKGDWVDGVLPPDWPAAILPMARTFAAGFPKSAAPMTPSQIEDLRENWAAAAKAPQVEPIDENDIPF